MPFDSPTKKINFRQSTISSPRPLTTVRFGEAPKPAREARVLPRQRVCRGKHIGIRIGIDGCCLPSAGAALWIVNVKIRYSERSLRRL